MLAWTASIAKVFREITRGGNLAQVLGGVEAARANGIAIKINMVALKGQNQTDLLPMAEYCAANGFDLSIIETMPLGDGVAGRQDDYISVEEFIAPVA